VEPIGQSVKIAAERAKGAHRVLVAIRGNCHDVEGCADIEAGGIGVDRGERS
jgi:hypothetical protein